MSWEDEVPGIIESMKGWYEIKVRGILGGGPRDDEHVTILGRQLRWPRGAREIEYEADPKYAKDIIKQMGLHEDSKGLGDPLCGGRPANIKEVRWLPTEVLEDGHGRHGQTCPVYETADVSIQLDVAEIVLLGVNL